MIVYLRKFTTKYGVDRIFRVIGYGTVLILCSFVLFSFLEPHSWTDAIGDFLAGVVLAISLISIVALLILRIHQPRRTVPIPIVSPRGLWFLRALSVVSSICLLFVLGTAYGDTGFGGIFLCLPLWLPLLLILAFLNTDRLKKGVALAVTMGCALFFASIAIQPVALDWEKPWWIQLLLCLAALAYLIMASMGVRTYYALPRERHDLRKLLRAFVYSFALLVLFTIALPYEDPKAIHGQMAQAKLREIHMFVFVYATRFGGVFPETLGALGSPPRNQKADCRAAGLLLKPLNMNSGGYIFEYRTDFPSHTVPGGCQGAAHYTITARPVVYGKTGKVNLYTDEGGVIRCTIENRPANADDSEAFCDFSRHAPG